MLLMMGVSLYTVRVVLSTLGEVDYGIFNVVAGVVTMFSFLSATMAGASQRFFAFELGRGDLVQLKKTFSMTMTIYLILAVVILILAETVGLWFLNNKMTIPAERMEAANWIFQFAILSFMVSMFAIPYNAAIIAHERMQVYAWVSLVEVALKLGVVYVLVLFSVDKLKLYAVLTFVVTLLVSLMYRAYCKRKFEECRFSFYWNKPLFREIVGYSGWNLFGSLAGVFNNQGISIILNLFFGPVVNAAQAVAVQVNNAINQFVQNFMMATRPQITKYYASGEKERMLTLVFQSSKYSFLLLFVLTMPILLETNYIFTLWLKDVPEHVVIFTRLIIVSALVDSLSLPLMAAAQATGKVKLYQTTVGGFMLLNLPLSYFLLRMGYPASIIFYLAIINSFLCLFIRLLLLRKMVCLPIGSYFKGVLLPIIATGIFSYIFPFLVSIQLNESFLRLCMTAFVGLISSGVIITLIGLSINEKIYISQSIKKITYKCLKLKR